MLIALNVILSFFSFNIGSLLIISFNFLIYTISAFFLGPALSLFIGGAADIIRYIVRPTGPYYFIFTFTAMLSGLIYGLVIFKKKFSITRIAIACFLQEMICSVFLNTLALQLIYGKAFFVLLPTRITKAIVFLPVEIFVSYFVLKFLHINKKNGL